MKYLEEAARLVGIWTITVTLMIGFYRVGTGYYEDPGYPERPMPDHPIYVSADDRPLAIIVQGHIIYNEQK